MIQKYLAACCLAALFILSACAQIVEDPAPATPVPPTITPLPVPPVTHTPIVEPPPIPFELTGIGTITPTVSLTSQTVFGFTYQNPDGNRYVEGLGSLGTVAPFDILLSGVPEWVVAAPIDGGGSIWTAVLDDGRTQSFFILAGQVAPISISPDRLPPHMPPLLMVDQGLPTLVTVPQDDASPLTHPVILDGGSTNYAYVANGGDLAIHKDGLTTRLDIGALPDARILQDESGRLLVLGGATSRYPHGVLGDQIEASTINLIGTDPPEVLASIPAAGRVVEGILPLWFDLDQDGEREIIVTLSDEVSGAQLVVISEGGEYLAESPAAGRGFRWRHLLAAVPFGPSGEYYLVDNLTPHIDPITELFTWQGNSLELLTSLGGLSTHQLGSRNLDRTLAGDLDGNGVIEILVPSIVGRGLIALNLINNSFSVGWRIQLNAGATTNIASVALDNGLVAVGIGMDNHTLRVWHP